MNKQPSLLDFRFTYNRKVARQYAMKWGTPHENNDSSQVGLNIGAGSDCANFASQVLKAGGYPLTNDWYYRQNKAKTHILKKTPSWSGVPYLLNHLIGVQRYEGAPVSDTLSVHAEYWEFNYKFGKTQQYDMFQWDNGTMQMPFPLIQSDLIFYIKKTKKGWWFDHVAVIVGFAKPYGFYQGGGFNLDTINVKFENYLAEGLVPWIIDHGVNAKLQRVRPFDYFPGAYRGKWRIGLVSIPYQNSVSSHNLYED